MYPTFYIDKQEVDALSQDVKTQLWGLIMIIKERKMLA